MITFRNCSLFASTLQIWISCALQKRKKYSLMIRTWNWILIKLEGRYINKWMWNISVTYFYSLFIQLYANKSNRSDLDITFTTEIVFIRTMIANHVELEIALIKWTWLCLKFLIPWSLMTDLMRLLITNVAKWKDYHLEKL